MFIRFLVVLAAALAVGAGAAGTSLAVPPCWPDCEQPEPGPVQYDPTGRWDKPVQDFNGTPYQWQDDDLAFAGWAGDLDARTQAIDVRLDVYRYDETDPQRRTVFDQSIIGKANQFRSDVPSAYGPYHGYRVEIPVLKPIAGVPMKLVKVCMTAINIYGGEDAPLYPNHSAYQNSGNCYVWFYWE